MKFGGKFLYSKKRINFIKMSYLQPPSTSKTPDVLKKALEYGYQINPRALKVLESLDERKLMVVLNSFSEKFPEAVTIETEQVEEILEKPATKTTGIVKSGLKLSGKITEIYDGSGLIQRCPKCDRWIIDDFCIVHSDVDGIWDLRIKARFADGKGRCTLIFKKDVAEKSANITLEEAKKLGAPATLERIKKVLIGKNFQIEGVALDGGNFLVKDIFSLGEI